MSNGDYVVSPNWNNGTGAVTRLDGTMPSIGVLSAAQSLAGSKPHDRVGWCAEVPCVRVLAHGEYVVISPHWSQGAIASVGAVTRPDGAQQSRAGAAFHGIIDAGNSVRGTADSEAGCSSIRY